MISWFIQSYYKNQLEEFKRNTLNEQSISQNKSLQLIKRQSTEQLTVLGAKIGELEAHSKLLYILTERLIKQSNLPQEEFDFVSLSTMAEGEDTQKIAVFQSSAISKQIEKLDRSLIKKEKQLKRLEIVLNNRHIGDQLYISGRPVKGKNAWVSSAYGARKDPFTGKLKQHLGVDIAGAAGLPLIATAAGVVVQSGKISGYGLMVEIQHGNGLATRYAHAIELTVKTGDVVAKGQQVAVMGTSGRSTGPHIHYEVLKNGRQVDPEYYIYRIAG
ncbi:MAG: M23 family metallopeptidase [Psychromonas sp.]